tara:strand:+ start:7568 stop:7771 length:204 start_codon:yes stop_codon:yes gene_type:complete
MQNKAEQIERIKQLLLEIEEVVVEEPNAFGTRDSFRVGTQLEILESLTNKLNFEVCEVVTKFYYPPQ